MRSIFGWSYPPGCNGPPDIYDDTEGEDEWECEVCGVPTQEGNFYCGPSCEQIAEATPYPFDWDWFERIECFPFVLVRSTENPFHIPTNELEFKEKKDETP